MIKEDRLAFNKKTLFVFVALLTFSGFLSLQIILEKVLKTEQKEEFALQSIASFSKKASYENNLQHAVFRDIEGKEYDVHTLEAPLIILNFWASWCAPCLEELPSLVALSKHYKPNQLHIIAINAGGEGLATIQMIAEKYQINFPLILQDGEHFAQNFGVDSLPTSLVFHNGILVETIRGSKNFVEHSILEKFNNLLAKQ